MENVSACGFTPTDKDSIIVCIAPILKTQVTTFWLDTLERARNKNWIVYQIL